MLADVEDLDLAIDYIRDRRFYWRVPRCAHKYHTAVRGRARRGSLRSDIQLAIHVNAEQRVNIGDSDVIRFACSVHEIPICICLPTALVATSGIQATRVRKPDTGVA